MTKFKPVELTNQELTNENVGLQKRVSELELENSDLSTALAYAEDHEQVSKDMERFGHYESLVCGAATDLLYSHKDVNDEDIKKAIKAKILFLLK